MSDLSETELNAATTVHDRLSALNVNAYVEPIALIEADRLQRAALEIKRHRTAQAADRERVREVVETAAAAVLGPNGPLGARSWDVLAHQIATRVAVQLAAARPVLSEEEIQALERLRGGSTSLAFQAIRKIIAAYRGAP